MATRKAKKSQSKRMRVPRRRVPRRRVSRRPKAAAIKAAKKCAAIFKAVGAERSIPRAQFIAACLRLK